MVTHSLYNTEKERNVLFNNALNTFYLRLYGIRHMVTDHSDSEKGYPLPPHRLLLSINSKGSLYAPSHRQDNTYHGLCYTSRGALAGREISQWVHPMKDRSDDPSHHERTLYIWATSRSLYIIQVIKEAVGGGGIKTCNNNKTIY